MSKGPNLKKLLVKTQKAEFKLKLYKFLEFFLFKYMNLNR
jgi:hypothetical protein